MVPRPAPMSEHPGPNAVGSGASVALQPTVGEVAATHLDEDAEMRRLANEHLRNLKQVA
jgi:hypothetical protein